MVALIEHPDQLDALVRQPGLMPTAVEEILRWTTATLYNRRTATRTTVIGGQVIEEGDKVTLWWPSANRDADVFDQPFRFDITRTPNPHLTFGHRTHYCMGANLARLEIRVILEELLGRLDGFALGGPVERVRTNKHAGVCKVPMTFRPRTPG
jgi:cytochrome P450